MIAQMLTEEQAVGKTCRYKWFVNGEQSYCGAPAVAIIGNRAVCQEHLNFIRSSRPTPLEPAHK